MGYESVQERFSRVAAEFAPQVAIMRGARQITYGELEAESNRLANFLLESCIALVVYRVAQEAVTNIARQTARTMGIGPSRVNLDLEFTSITDNSLDVDVDDAAALVPLSIRSFRTELISWSGSRNG